MSLIELLPTIHALPRADKLRLMQVLVAEIASEEAIALPPTDTAHTTWSPYDACDAAATLLRVLHEDQAQLRFGS
jgi:hypothetical protein